ncbi:hypothetical protein MCO_01227 [Bartonella sp. DB5-6]|uniref:hypothetical protein n=1 Tax=Bartonella sp. DB5-6 TaxID=1094755 RepID=UPI00026E9E80|nr:hypothetical protein [Bartonella sp. DB5-6]EJF77496.1 hypothetical protein MCO_01227 [Bartonella sp. DB5-6]
MLPNGLAMYGRALSTVSLTFGAGWEVFFAQEKLSDDAKAGMEQAGEDLANWIVDGFMAPITKLSDFFKSLPSRIREWIGSVDLSDLFHLPSWLGGKTAIQPIAQFAGAGHANPSGPEQREKDRSPTTHNQNVTVHINGARDPVATGRAVSHALQRARANALHGGTE